LVKDKLPQKLPACPEVADSEPENPFPPLQAEPVRKRFPPTLLPDMVPCWIETVSLMSDPHPVVDRRVAPVCALAQYVNRVPLKAPPDTVTVDVLEKL